jgi:hypothetical protein
MNIPIKTVTIRAAHREVSSARSIFSAPRFCPTIVAAPMDTPINGINPIPSILLLMPIAAMTVVPNIDTNFITIICETLREIFSNPEGNPIDNSFLSIPQFNLNNPFTEGRTGFFFENK